MRRVFVILLCFLIMLPAMADPFFDQVWVFPGFVKRQKLIIENDEYRFNPEVWQAEVSVSMTEAFYPYTVFDEMLYIENGTIYFVDLVGQIAKASSSDVQFMQDGFARLNIANLSMTVIFGSFLFATPRCSDWKNTQNYSKVRRFNDSWKKIRDTILNNRKPLVEIDRKTFLYQPVKDMIVPSCLREMVRGEEIVYGTDFYKYRWLYEFGHVYSQMDYLDGVPPWVEAEPGNGTGLEFEVLFSESVDNIVFLNGFVDMQRKHLYKQNARMQTIQIEGDGFTREFTFIDQVRFQEIEFPKKTEKIKVTVLSVYPGSKYEDMAISGMYVRTEPEGISEEEKQRRYREHIEMIKEMYQKQKW